MEPSDPVDQGGPARNPVRFVIPGPLLHKLREHRAREQAARAERARAAAALPPRPRTLGERVAARSRAVLRWLHGRLTGRRAAASRPLAIGEVVAALSGPEDVEVLAQAYSKGMLDLQDEVEGRYDAFLLCPGMGPMTYLTADGRLLSDNRTWDGDGVEEETSLDEAIASLVVGARQTGIADLLTLIPKLPGGEPCPWCSGGRMIRHTADGEPALVCVVCRGRGEVDERLRAWARKAGFLT